MGKIPMDLYEKFLDQFIGEGDGIAFIRQKLLDQEVGVSIGVKYRYLSERPLPYRWINKDNKFQVYFNSSWHETVSTDWDFDKRQEKVRDMESKSIYLYLCTYDKRNPNGVSEKFPERTPRTNCNCSNCFNGGDDLAMEILKLREKLRKLRKGGKNTKKN